MTQTIVGAISDRLGHAAGWQTVQARHAGRNFDAQRTFWACPTDRFRHEQPPDVPLEAGHGGPRIGTVVHLEATRDEKLWVVAEVDNGFDLTHRPWQLSYDLSQKYDGLYDLNAVAVVEKSATCAMPTIQVRDGDLATAVRSVTRHDGIVETMIRNAREETGWRKRGAPIEIRGLEAPRTPEQEQQAYYARSALERGIDTRPRAVGHVEFSSHRGEILSVR